MNNTPLEDQVHDALRRTADPLHRTPFTVGDVRTRARRIQRRRAAVAAGAVAAVLAVAVPIGAAMVGPAQRSEVPPATQTPAPRLTGPILVDPRSAEVVESTSVPLLDVDGARLLTQEGTVDLPRAYDSLTPYLDGWVAVANEEGTLTLEVLDDDLRVVGDPVPTGGLVVSTDGQQVAWTEYADGRWQVVRAPVAGGTEPDTTPLAPGPEGAPVRPVGFLSATEVVVDRFDEAGEVTTYVVGDGAADELPGLLQATSSSAATGTLAGLTSTDLASGCSGVVDGRGQAGTRTWETCDHTLDSFSPDGRHIVGFAPDSDGYGSPTVSILDADTGEAVVDFEVAGSRRQVAAFHDRVGWDGDDTAVLTLLTGDERFVVRLGVDGSVQRVGGATSIDSSGLVVAEVR
ncbi:hypothetical protein GCM10011376_17250 [Nocardioides flavus (ex Wang et al. 2016)]|uniref:WD40-like Beta Propeller Repeat n=1 Tax=Nocardioides flavus (ex Wang et al. 2016) TaxID=2058780 RepID=A0ABQ3HMP0_9ACTN|nr:hypothetical protein [Nocardioides flavus (ex Wang et al. 2016)]GHE17115.1 hypothetical protein GCM10011376_17250 [Nocardioides flavus (ex Wang et al. 2016)]